MAFDTMQGRKQFTVRGILKAGGMAQAFGGNLGIMDIYAAQSVFGRGRHFDRIDIGLQEGVSARAGRGRALGSCWGRASPWSRLRAAARSSNRCSASTPWR